ncbi:MAG TPA: glycosyltransferase family 4 protein [Methylococcaceae bacterium]|nr:glycosyltransferase family 4 protein [Methylococcaceae bacterium]
MNDQTRILVLLTDAYGGHGGISRFNRDFLGALSAHENVREILVFPRLVRSAIEETILSNIRFVDRGVTSKMGYVKTVLAHVIGDRKFDLLVCGHINLLPLCWLLSRWIGCPLALIIHGIDAWEPTGSRLVDRLAKRVDAVVAVSRLSLQRFCAWSGTNPDKGFILPNTVDLSLFTPGPQNPELLNRYGLENKTVLMTLGRMPCSERYKGYDEIIELLPALSERIPDVAYLLAGNGDDRPRLERKAQELGVGKQVVFAGMIPESEKVDHYRLADAYVMPSRGEGFGIVLLEAMACGIPVVASKLDGGREALRDGLLGELVDPLDSADILRGVLQALKKPRGVPEGLEYFSMDGFRQRVHDIVDGLLAGKAIHG